MIFDYSRMTRDELQQVISIVTIGQVLRNLTTEERRGVFMDALAQLEETTPLTAGMLEDQADKFLVLCRNIMADMGTDGPIMKYVRRLQDDENTAGRFDA